MFYYNSEDDPDYIPSDTESDVWMTDDEPIAAPSTSDRCLYIQTYHDELQSLYESLTAQADSLPGPAALQLCTFEHFANFCYRNTQPVSD